MFNLSIEDVETAGSRVQSLSYKRPCLNKEMVVLVVVAHICNLSIFGGGGWQLELCSKTLIKTTNK